MTYLVNIIVTLTLLMFQTAILPVFSIGETSYDLLILLILHLGFTLSLGESFSIVLFSGLFMDSFSGGAFGIFTTTYVWFFVLIRGVTCFFHVDSRILVVCAIIVGVVLENLIIFFSVSIGTSSFHLSPYAAWLLAWQVFWAVLTGPVIIKLFYGVHLAGGALSRRFSQWNEDRHSF